MTKAVESAIVEKNTATRVRSNIAAINLIRDLKARDYAATPAEQETLAKFVGWGGLREDVFGYELERAYDMERSGDAEAAKRGGADGIAAINTIKSVVGVNLIVLLVSRLVPAKN